MPVVGTAHERCQQPEIGSVGALAPNLALLQPWTNVGPSRVTDRWSERPSAGDSCSPKSRQVGVGCDRNGYLVWSRTVFIAVTGLLPRQGDRPTLPRQLREARCERSPRQYRLQRRLRVGYTGSSEPARPIGPPKGGRPDPGRQIVRAGRGRPGRRVPGQPGLGLYPRTGLRGQRRAVCVSRQRLPACRFVPDPLRRRIMPFVDRRHGWG
jgi:hypothetical protein